MKTLCDGPRIKDHWKIV